MNAQPHATATALAHAQPHASSAGSVDAKGSEGKGQDRTGPHPTEYLHGATSHPFSPNVSARAATEPSDTHQPHATATAWMRAATITRDDTTTGIATIEGIDFSADVACDAQNDGGCEYNNPAEYITAGTCPHCGNLQRFPTCGPCLRDIWEGASWCPACDQRTSGQEMRIVEVLR